MNNHERGRQIRAQILRDVRDHPQDLARHIGDIFSITPQAVHSHLQRLEAEKLIEPTGSGKGKRYFLGDIRRYQGLFELDGTLEEDRIWRNLFSFIFDGLLPNVFDICHYGFTEMVNNVIDHSGGSKVVISASRDMQRITISVTDDGEGIFRRIKRLCNLTDEKHALFELSKGKLTTDPDNHTGEGIFFTSRAFDFFEIESKGLTFSHHESLEYDYLTDSPMPSKDVGTSVAMMVARNSTRTIESVFDEFTAGPTEFQFDRTVVPMRLAQYGNEKLISRSQAKRVLARIEKFKRVIFDFEGVESVGQAFADEIFRVYTKKNPTIIMVPHNMNTEVAKMVNRAVKAK